MQVLFSDHDKNRNAGTLKNPRGAFLVSPRKTNYQIRPVMRLYGHINLYALQRKAERTLRELYT